MATFLARLAGGVPYVRQADILADPWGEIYQYRIPGDHGTYDLFTLGADQAEAEGGEGENQDITSW